MGAFLAGHRKYGHCQKRVLGSQFQKTYLLPKEGTTDFAMYSTAESIFSLGNKIVSFAAAVLILVPVVVLHFLQDANWRLAVIVIFSLSFTATLVMGTSADRAQVFAATAAFVAVQVVYVGSALAAPH